ncbi:MAG TPA: 1-acyl-sn-glycerol-3-phosphate acyltransferase [bacterium]|nr:1-acyl-sn-glycerol-3-phosphate acyltransferase [bacterium]
MPQKLDYPAIEQKVLDFFQRSFASFRALLKGFISALKNYIRRKSRFVPSVLPKGRREMIARILEHPHHQDFLQDFARECGMPIDHVEQTFRESLREIASDLNYIFIAFWDFLLTWVFETIYEGLDIDHAALETIRPLVGQRPVVFVPNHRSHMDYLILSYVLHDRQIPVPYICAGSNLSFWPLGSLFRKSGAFFIRRSYEGNKLYAAAVQAYIEELIREKSCLEFFIEGTRSRTGKLIPPRMGILSSVVHAFERGAADDVMIVPTSFTYESVLEDKSYLEEQAGAVKKEEGFWDLLRLRKYLRRRQGKVYIRFGDVISLKDYMTAAGATASDREKIRELAYEITYGINKSAVVTPAALTATVLLTQPRRAIAAKTLHASVDRYLDYLKFKESRLSEPLQKYQSLAIRESLRGYIRSHLVQEFYDFEEPLYRVVEDKRALLDYYKNTSVHFFVSLGVLAAVLSAAPNGRISRARAEEDFLFLRELFQYEFTFSRRQPVAAHVDRLLDYLVPRGMVRVEGPDLAAIPEARDALETLASPIRNFIEAYGIVWRTLPHLGTRRWEQKELLRFLQERGRILYLKEEIDRPEAINKFTLHHALSSFRDLGLFKEEVEGWGRRKRTFYQQAGRDENFMNNIKRFLQ